MLNVSLSVSNQRDACREEEVDSTHEDNAQMQRDVDEVDSLQRWRDCKSENCNGFGI